eukprot:CAMPEP_0182439958 /NCGR_PEP_ID=MMETSP1167-20130531/86751_1 /TAXON_ID=2988 /ORGANISM="Mallomonas Sp, Strain CCMP3275" /LENGTH=419 /DNA_ID=CAMNT_0024633767 /DNA_START=919 /DNA_END=2178 /DNA_ORIENTATION=-
MRIDPVTGMSKSESVATNTRSQTQKQSKLLVRSESSNSLKKNRFVMSDKEIEDEEESADLIEIWQCERCTYENRVNIKVMKELECEVCGSSRPERWEGGGEGEGEEGLKREANKRQRENISELDSSSDNNNDIPVNTPENVSININLTRTSHPMRSTERRVYAVHEEDERERQEEEEQEKRRGRIPSESDGVQEDSEGDGDSYREEEEEEEEEEEWREEEEEEWQERDRETRHLSTEESKRRNRREREREGERPQELGEIVSKKQRISASAPAIDLTIDDSEEDEKREGREMGRQSGRQVVWTERCHEEEEEEEIECFEDDPPLQETRKSFSEPALAAHFICVKDLKRISDCSIDFKKFMMDVHDDTDVQFEKRKHARETKIKKKKKSKSKSKKESHSSSGRSGGWFRGGGKRCSKSKT